MPATSDIKRCPHCSTPTDLQAIECRKCGYAYRMVVMTSQPYDAPYEVEEPAQTRRRTVSTPPPIIIDLPSDNGSSRPRFRMRRHHWNFLSVLVAALVMLAAMKLLSDAVHETTRAAQMDR